MTKLVGGDVGAWKGSAREQGREGVEPQRTFSSRYSPLFQKCVVDVEAKFLADGKGELKSLEGAFRICNKSIGERKFGAHAVKKDGTPVEDIELLARRYEALLIRHRAIILKALEDPSQSS